MEMTKGTGKVIGAKSLAITSLVFGILAIAFPRGLIGLASALVAIVFGLIALYAMKQSGDFTGRKKAQWGLGLGISSIIILLIMFSMEVRTQRVVDGLRESHPELFNANLEKPESKFTKVEGQDLPPKWRIGKTVEESINNYVQDCLKQETLLQDGTEGLISAVMGAREGNATIQHLLGSWFSKGDGVKQDYKEAVYWYRKAAEQGVAEAQYNLACMYYKGIGVVEDYVEAYKWTILAGMNGYLDVSHHKKTLKEQMTSFQIAEAQKRAKAFVKSKPHQLVQPLWVAKSKIQSPAPLTYEQSLLKDVNAMRPLLHTGIPGFSLTLSGIKGFTDEDEAALSKVARDTGKSVGVLRFVYASISDNTLALGAKKELSAADIVRDAVEVEKTIAVDQRSRPSSVEGKIGSWGDTYKWGMVTSIGHSGNKYMITMNRKILFENDEVDGARIVKIYKDRVELEKNGKSWTQYVGTPPNPAWQE